MTNPHQWTGVTLGMGPWRRWLTDHGSLTRRLQSRCPAFQVKRLRQGICQPYRDEIEPLGLRRRRRSLVREVLLQCGPVPLVFAHTVIPLDGLRGPWQSLAGLGNRSLGTTLFANPKIERFPLEYRCLDDGHPLFRAAIRHTDADTARLWARRSLFILGRHPIQVTEVFLPAIFDLPKR